MMIPAAFTTAYGLVIPLLNQIEQNVKPKLETELDDYGLLSVTSRVKFPDSTYEKLQTGRYDHFRSLRDLVGMTVVMRRRADVVKAIEVVKASGLTIVDEIQPVAVSPSDFRYREPKLIVAPAAAFVDRHPEVDGLYVEVQITSALQHALDMATHDFDFKGKDYVWEKFRLVAQLRGMLELVDGMLDDPSASAPMLSGSTNVPPEFARSSEVLAVIIASFHPDDLPENRRRLVDTTMAWLEAVSWTAADLQAAIQASGKLAEACSLSVTDRLLGVILQAKADVLIATYKGNLCITVELLEVCPEATAVPASMRVGF